MAQHIRFLTLAAATAFMDAISTGLGYPFDAVEVGGGIHAPAAAARTLRHFILRRHPALASWEFPLGERVQTFLDNHPNLPGAANRVIEERTDDWDDPPAPG